MSSKDDPPLLAAATRILEKVNSEYGSGDAYLSTVWGKLIAKREVMQAFKSYCRAEHLSDIVRVRASSSINCSAHVIALGPPRRRKYSVTVRCSDGNCYMRDKAVLGLAYSRPRDWNIVWGPAPFALTGKGLVSAVSNSCTSGI